ncbi:MAG TPA: glycosidase-like protein, partial [Mycobacteriales bacterium]|nr:glycosidase-like protein [Mycobacteriales bacterium]
MDEPAALLTRTDVSLHADPTRVLARLFVPGHELLGDHESRASGVLGRILALPEAAVAATLRRVHVRYAGRHRDLPGVLLAHYQQIAHRVVDDATLTAARRALIGACFTHEFSVEGAALFNPSAVAHPDQSNLPGGHCRFLLSLRAVGEGHTSSVEFRVGVLGPPGGGLIIEDPGCHVESGLARSSSHDRGLFAALLAEEGADADSASYLVAHLPENFHEDDLERALAALTGQPGTRHTDNTGALARRLARCSYEVEFAPLSTIPERVLWPHAPSESHGIEDARFVRFVDDDGSLSYRATYTAFDGDRIAPQLIETDDFRCFRMSQLAGPAAKNKGLALFPRKVRGRYLALSRWDRESTAIASSRDG